MRALVVDDSPAMRKLLAAHLVDRGYEVRTTDSGERALEQHHREPFDLLLVDWTLPGMSGLDLCRAIRASPKANDPVILVITGRNQPADLHAVLDAGATDYLAKPVDPDVLATRLLIAARQADSVRKRREGEQALVSAEEAFRRLVEAAPDAILVVRDGRVAYSNPRFVRFLGYDSASQLEQKPVREFVHPDDPITILEPQDGPAAPVEARFLRRDGSSISGEAITVRSTFGRHPALLAMIRDVSERRDMQARLLLADRMANVGTLAASVAHELNNPLAYVLSNLRLSREELDEPIDPERLALIKMQLDEAGHGARRMRDILREMMTFASGEEKPDTLIDVNDLLSSCINMCHNELRHRARVETAFGECEPVRMDPSKAGQVFLNILINAAQAMDETRASTNVVSIHTESSGGTTRVRIRDTGRGIAADDIGHIFDAFFTTREDDGSGLGLSIAQNIVKLAGGTIDVESVVGEGTTLTITLPSATGVKPKVEPVSPSKRAASTARPAHVLVVDDEELVGRSIRRALRAHDVQVVTRGRDAIRLLCASPAPNFDIVFCDLMMPEVSGMDVFSAVSRDAPEMAKRFVFMTGGAFTPRARRFLESLPNTCMEKPFDLALVRTLTVDAAARDSN